MRWTSNQELLRYVQIIVSRRLTGSGFGCLNIYNIEQKLKDDRMYFEPYL